MLEKEAAVYGRPRDHYARELLGGRAFINGTWVSNLALALAVAGTIVWTNRVQHDMARQVRTFVVAFENAAHPTLLTQEWVPGAGDWLEIAGTFARYVRSRPIDKHILMLQRQWAQARSSKSVDGALAESLAHQDKEFGEDGIEVELVSTVVQETSANAAVVLVRWKERVHKRAGAVRDWKPYNSLVRMIRDEDEAKMRFMDQTPQNRALIFPNPMGIFITNFEPNPERPEEKRP